MCIELMAYLGLIAIMFIGLVVVCVVHDKNKR